MSYFLFSIPFFAGLAYLLRRLQQKSVVLEQKILSLETDIGALCGAASEMGDQLYSLKAALKGAVSRQDQFEGSMGRQQEQPYRHAIALIKKGASVDELMATCGLARGEAELVGNLYGKEDLKQEPLH